MTRACLIEPSGYQVKEWREIRRVTTAGIAYLIPPLLKYMMVLNLEKIFPIASFIAIFPL